MAPTKRKQQTKQSNKQVRLTGAGGKFFPLLKKANEVIGKFIAVPGTYWDHCPANDKDKIFKCLVVEFVACYDFGHFKSNGYKVCVPRSERACDCARCIALHSVEQRSVPGAAVFAPAAMC